MRFSSAYALSQAALPSALRQPPTANRPLPPVRRSLGEVGSALRPPPTIAWGKALYATALRPPAPMSTHRLLFEAWLIYLVGIVVLGWSLSLLQSYQWLGWASVPLIAGCILHVARGWKHTPREDRGSLLSDLRFPPTLIVVALVILAGTLYLSTVLDSLSYRIPRVLIWLQEGRVTFVDNPDGRINFMTPIWEFASTPLYLVSGFRFLWLGSLISWIMLYLSMVRVSIDLGVEQPLARWMALIPAASVGFVLQASSTMNDLWAASLISISLVFILRFEKNREFRDIIGSGFALALAAGTKPHFAILALPWLLWAVFSRSRPLPHVKWRWTLPAAAIAVLCSPIPTFFSNHANFGSWAGPAGDGGFGFGSPWLNLVLGGLMMIWSVFQLPINPFAKQTEAFTASLIRGSGLHDLPSRFQLGSREVTLVDGASLGLVAAVALLAGILIALRKSREAPPWPLLAALAGIFGLVVAISQVVPSTLGRSFLGFLVLLIPLGIKGLARLDRKWIIGASVCSLLASLATLVLSPSHPLWPAKTVAKSVPRLASFMEPYIAFQERSTAGISLASQIPRAAGEVGILANGDQNLIHLWDAGRAERGVRFFPGDVTLDDLAANGPNFIILAGNGDGRYTDFGQRFANDPRFSIIAQESYQTRNDRGKEPWLLIRRNLSPASSYPH